MSLTEKLYELYLQNPALTNAEAAQMLGILENHVSNYKYRLRKRGFIADDENGNVKILREMHTGTTGQLSFKGEIYMEMVDTYMEDFRAQTTFADRLAVGREIRLILERM